jgi:nitroreductase
MVRRYDPSRPVPHEVLVACLDAATRAPSAGFTQGWDFVVLTSDAQRQAFWGATRESEDTDTWLAGLMTAPTLILCASDPNAYLDRYTEADKGWTDRDPDRWPIPYWDVDTGMAAMLMLLTAVDQGIGGCFFGVPTGRHTPVRAALGIPEDRRLVGVISLGYAVPHPKSPSLRRGRRTVEDVAHWGRFGGSPAPTDAAVGEDKTPSLEG